MKTKINNNINGYDISLHRIDISIGIGSFSETPDKYKIEYKLNTKIWLKYEGQWYRINSKDNIDSVLKILTDNIYSKEIFLDRILSLI